MADVSGIDFDQAEHAPVPYADYLHQLEAVAEATKEAAKYREDRDAARFNGMRQAMVARRKEIDRLADHIEIAMFEAKAPETVSVLLALAQKLLS